ncbi:hypothetical protein AVEN_186178-1 [Araneus ventricosus]|uniref:Uncharacterized protein n=1 Tax=Araneus ventricosus TaxID=182803 RepID=A0A4Y2GGP7_ARAVE|nr:hypothetical protein AVEN_186178-1 [Araneus ventricosus]
MSWHIIEGAKDDGFFDNSLACIVFELTLNAAVDGGKNLGMVLPLIFKVVRTPSSSEETLAVLKCHFRYFSQFAKSSQIRLGLPSTVVVGDRFGVSDRAVVAIASSVLHDVGLITSNNSDLVVDENMLRRERLKSRYLSQDHKDVVDGVICRNSFFAHPENILLCMLKYERLYIRELAA